MYEGKGVTPGAGPDALVVQLGHGGSIGPEALIPGRPCPDTLKTWGQGGRAFLPSLQIPPCLGLPPRTLVSVPPFCGARSPLPPAL